MPKLPDIIEIGYSRKRLLVLLAGGVVLTAGCAAMAFHLFPDMQVGQVAPNPPTIDMISARTR